MPVSRVPSNDISAALRRIGVKKGDVCLFHSSFRSFGHVEGGAQAVIDGFEAVLGREGTLAVPTLCQVDFHNSYKTWYMDKPSDVGYLTEYFRKQMYVYRSNQATHSVAARGKLAYELTHEHTAYGPHLCPFGEYAFADSSPWRKLYNLNAKIVFVGVSLNSHTMKHMIESTLVEELLRAIPDGDERMRMQNQLMRFEGGFTGIWPFYNADAMHEPLRAMGLIRETKCGDSELMCIDARDTADAMLNLLRASPEKYLGGAAADWMKECLSLSASSEE